MKFNFAVHGEGYRSLQCKFPCSFLKIRKCSKKSVIYEHGDSLRKIETARQCEQGRSCAHAALDWRREETPAIFLRTLPASSAPRLDRASASVCFIYSQVCKALPSSPSRLREGGEGGGGFAGARVMRVPGLKVHVRIAHRVAQAKRIQGRHKLNSPNGHHTPQVCLNLVKMSPNGSMTKRSFLGDNVFVHETKSRIAVYPGQPVLDTLRAGIG